MTKSSKNYTTKLIYTSAVKKYNFKLNKFILNNHHKLTGGLS